MSQGRAAAASEVSPEVFRTPDDSRSSRRRTFPASDLRKPMVWVIPAPAHEFVSTGDLRNDAQAVALFDATEKGELGKRRPQTSLTPVLGVLQRCSSDDAALASRGPGTGSKDSISKKGKMQALEMLTREFGPAKPVQSSGISLVSSSMPLVAGDSDGALPWRRRAGGTNHFCSTPAQSRATKDDDLLSGNPHTDSARAGLSLAIHIGQVFSLMPISPKTRTIPKFRWCSLRVLYTLLVATGLFSCTALVTHYNLQRDDGNSPTIEFWNTTVFYMYGVVVSMLFFRLALRWRSMCLSFRRAEAAVGYPPKLGMRLKIITSVFLLLAMLEHGFSQATIFLRMQTSLAKPINEFLFDYYSGIYPYIRDFFPYNPIVALSCVFLNIAGTFMWNYNDVFIMLISFIISQLFRLFNTNLQLAAKKEQSEAFWRRSRESYNTLAQLTRSIDDHLSPNVLFSFLTNLYFICLQLLHTVRGTSSRGVDQSAYFIYSFGFLLIRLASVSLFAASIQEESRAVRRTLYGVSSTSYCTEVDRFLAQVTTDDIAFTGMKFFHVTRPLLLTMAGTITTYEIVLVQFNQGKPEES